MGRAFPAGHDLKWSEQEHVKGMTEAELVAATECPHAIPRQIRACPVPVVARVHGHARSTPPRRGPGTW
ncbi:hypothetical protein [Streptomyces sp. RB17]|uniref:hypothetical protein n=1 Tax=Streptomyces sp. RB17 TaxID=2585197 RepID=UPI001E4751BF|nr:hypothetical protein [Streptomyces sp. RB17]